MNRKGFTSVSAAILVLIVVLVLVVIGGIAYIHYVHLPKTAPQNNIAVVAAGLSADQKVALTDIDSMKTLLSSTSNPNLYLEPTPLNIPSFNSAEYPEFSYYGLSLTFPWKEQPNISSGSFGTSLRFPNGKSIVVTAMSQVIPSWRATYLSAPVPSGILPNGIVATFNDEYGVNVVPNYNFVSSILNSTPSQLSTDTASLASSFADAAFLVDKQPLLFVATSTALYNFSAPMTIGFESIGQSEDNNTSTDVAYFYVFKDASDTAHDFATYGLTQTEIDFILASLKVD